MESDSSAETAKESEEKKQKIQEKSANESPADVNMVYTLPQSLKEEYIEYEEMVRVFVSCSELFHTSWRVVYSIPTHGSNPEIGGLKSSTKIQKVEILVSSRVASAGLCTGTGLMAVPVRADGCTGTGLVYRYTDGFRANPRLGFDCFAGVVPGAKRVAGNFVGGYDAPRRLWWGRSLQVGTPEIAIATYARPCEIGRQNGMLWGRLIPRVGMLTTTGSLLARRRPDYLRTYSGSVHVPGRLPLSPGA
uniref:Uncharacterized protein n=1 Tax=Ananas comosus var. bracteatus TaxID=296719 RepID=A0A6V7NP92_ANACO|nr:unnamed protein product [Ananas comosus var. bracteatus]